MAASDAQLAALEAQLEHPTVQASADWQRWVRGYILRQGPGRILTGDAGDDEALRLLALPGVDLSTDSYRNTAATPDPRPTAGELMALESACYGRMRVLRWLTEQGVNLLAAGETGATARRSAQ